MGADWVSGLRAGLTLPSVRRVGVYSSSRIAGDGRSGGGFLMTPSDARGSRGPFACYRDTHGHSHIRLRLDSDASAGWVSV